MSAQGILFADPRLLPLSNAGLPQPGSFLVNAPSGQLGNAPYGPLYRDGALQVPFEAASLPISDMMAVTDGSGRFPPVYMDTSVVNRVGFYNPAAVVQYTTYGMNWPLGAFGNKYLSCDAEGHWTLTPVGNANGAALTLTSYSGLGDVALQLINGNLGGSQYTPTLAINQSATSAGTQTATFTATNKPGSAASAPVKWLAIICDGVTYYAPLFQ